MFPTPDVNTTVQFVQYVNNDLVNGFLGVGILFLLFIILLVRGNVTSSNEAFAGATFFTSLAAILLWSIGILSETLLYGAVFLSIASAIFFIAQRKK
jgi:hypothetical protein